MQLGGILQGSLRSAGLRILQGSGYKMATEPIVISRVMGKLHYKRVTAVVTKVVKSRCFAFSNRGIFRFHVWKF